MPRLDWSNRGHVIRSIMVLRASTVGTPWRWVKPHTDWTRGATWSRLALPGCWDAAPLPASDQRIPSRCGDVRSTTCLSAAHVAPVRTRPPSLRLAGSAFCGRAPRRHRLRLPLVASAGAGGSVMSEGWSVIVSLVGTASSSVAMRPSREGRHEV